MKKIGVYKIINEVRKTRNTCLYKAVKNESDGSESILQYIIKTYNSDRVAKKERDISQYVENKARNSIVIPIVDRLQVDGKEYVVMHLKEQGGYFLSDLIDILEKRFKGRIPLDIQIKLVEKLLISVKSLHNCLDDENEYQGYVHLDLHPGNIFVESVEIKEASVQLGSVKFIDFYNALPIRKRDGNVECGENDEIGVTPGFAAPETDRTSFSQISYGADLYSVAAIAARMFTGTIITNLFDAYESKVRKCDCNANLVLDNAMKTFILRGLEYNTLYRYRSAEEMLGILDKVKKCLVNKDDYYKLLCVSYDMCISNDEIYVGGMDYNTKMYEKSVMQLSDALHSSSYDSRRCCYIFDILWKINEKYTDKISDKIKGELISCGIACNNHMAKTEQVFALCEELKKYASSMSIMEYLNVINRCAEGYACKYCFQTAYDMIDKNIKSLEMLKTTLQDMTEYNQMCLEGGSARVVELGRAYSALGRYGTLLHRDSEEIESLFEKALKEFGNDTKSGRENQRITIGHILHYAVERRKIKLYTKYSEGYYKGNTKEEIIEYLTNAINGLPNNQMSFLYDMYIFLKGIYVFELDELSEMFINQLKAIVSETKIDVLFQHPLELIYKYIGLILHHYKVEDELINTAFVKSMSIVKEAVINLEEPLNIMMVITYQTMWVYNELTYQEEENAELFNLIREHAQNSGWTMLVEKLDNIGNLEEILCYEYN